MCDTNDRQMTYRYLRRRKGHILLIITSLVLLYIWSEALDDKSSYDVQDFKSNCKFPCFGQFCVNCHTTPPTTVRTVNIVEHLKLKRALRGSESAYNSSSNVSYSTQVCKRPNFDLKHDSVKYAFHKMPPINCSSEELFYIENNVFRINKTVLGSRELEKCKYYGVERVSDDYSTYTEPLTKENEPFDLVLLHDFVRIKCFLRENEKAEYKDIEFDSKKEVHNETVKDVQREVDYVEAVKKDLADVNDTNLQPDEKNTADLKKLNGENVDIQKIVRSVKSYDDYNNVDRESLEENETSREGERDYNAYWNEGWSDSYFNFEDKADFDQLFVQVNPKSEVFERIARKSTSRLSQRRMNVLMFGLDSMSHLSYQRKLPKTYKYLQELGAVIMDGYNIVGDATTAALIPMLTGDFIILFSASFLTFITVWFS